MTFSEATVTQDYIPLGTEEVIEGLKTYVTGPSDVSIGVVCAYDVFGITVPIQQAADILASTLNATVVVPDLLKGTYAQQEWFPLTTEQNRAAFFEYLHGYAFPPKFMGDFGKFTSQCKERFPAAKKWGSYGLCWGGKVVALASQSQDLFVASAQMHPGMLDPADAEKIAFPHLVLASKDEPVGAVAGFKTTIESKRNGGYVETYSMFHGWMGSNARLGDPEGRREYSRGYNELLEFFQVYLLGGHD